MKHRTHRISPSSLAKARDLRQNATLAERALWTKLCAGQLGGAKFRRQHVIGPFIVDFYCAKEKLVIEIDGRSHHHTTVEDTARTHYIESLGYRVIRYTNEDVLSHLQSVVMDIAEKTGVIFHD